MTQRQSMMRQSLRENRVVRFLYIRKRVACVLEFTAIFPETRHAAVLLYGAREFPGKSRNEVQ